MKTVSHSLDSLKLAQSLSKERRKSIIDPELAKRSIGIYRKALAEIASGRLDLDASRALARKVITLGFVVVSRD